MKKNEKAREEYRKIRRTLLAALCMLLVSSVMMATTSYAWFVMAVSPEVTGITTNVAANGSLEIALLTSETYRDPNSVRSNGVGTSLQADVLGANNTWGNLVDLNDASYGLSNILLMPARLDLKKTESGFSMGNNLLLAPIYGYDGRVMSVEADTISGKYDEAQGFFVTDLNNLNYGVRAIGASTFVTAQEAALALAKSNIRTYTSESVNFARGALNSNGQALFEIIFKKFTNDNPTYDDSEKKVVENMISGLDNSLTKIDAAMRQALVAYAASQLGDETLFKTANDKILDTSKTLSEVIGEVNGLPETFAGWVNDLSNAQNSLNTAKTACAKLTGGSYSWDDLEGALLPIMNMDEIMIGERKFPQADQSYLQTLMGKTIEMTLSPGSGVFADVADFADNYETSVKAMGQDILIQTMSAQKPTYLSGLASAVSNLNAAGGTGESSQSVQMDITYGYALDFGFRTNAAGSNLLLQTEASQRVYGDSTSLATMGGGSYMEFNVDTDKLTADQMVQLMDALRVAFISDGQICGIAKLNTSNRVITENDTVKAPLYLYDFEIGTDTENAGALIMGERQKTDNTLTNLTKGVAKAVTVLVWLDGDMVDNSMVPAEEDGLAMGGMLNLQFASSADLIPVGNKELQNLAVDMNSFEKELPQYTTIFEAGRGDYTSTSWSKFVAAYEYAKKLTEDDSAATATATQISGAHRALIDAKNGLKKIDLTELKKEVEKYREMMGKTTDEARYVVRDASGGVLVVNPYTIDQYDSKLGTVYRVDYNKNLQDEGNGLKTPKYTEASWSNLAAALYFADALTIEGINPTDEEIDAAIKSLEVANKALQRNVLYTPYLYAGDIYYKAVVTDKADTDTYGKWYDANFKRVVSDLTILKLDAKALAYDNYVSIDHSGWIMVDSEQADVVLSVILHSELKNDSILGVNWGVSGEFFIQKGTATVAQLATRDALVKRANALAGMDYAVSEAVLNTAIALTVDSAYQEAQDAIDKLGAAVYTAEIKQKIAEDNAKYQALQGDDKIISADVRTVLTLAVSECKTIEGFEDITNTELAELRADVDSAELILGNDGATNKMARDVLDKLNSHLTKAGKNEVTENNTIQHWIPVGSEKGEVVYIANSATYIRPSGKTGEGTVTAVVLTKNGVIVSIEKSFYVYAPADGVRIEDAPTAPVGVGQTHALKAKLIPNAAADADTIGEKIAKTTWSSSNSKIATVSGDGRVSGVAAGAVTITVLVETEAGNRYTAEIDVIIG